MTGTRGVAVLLGVTLAAGCGTAHSRPSAAQTTPAPATTERTSPTPAPVSVSEVLHSKAAAQAVTAALLKAVVLPAGAREVASDPSPALLRNTNGSVAITKVESFRWFLTSATPSQVAASVGAHVQNGLTCPSGMGADVYGGVRAYGMVCLIPRLASPWVDVDAVAVGGGLAVQVEAGAIWVPPKTSYDVVPADLTSARLSFSSAVEGLKNTAVTLSGQGLASLRKAINNAAVAPPQSMPNSCPPGQGEATLTVSSRVAFEIDVYGCRTVTVLVDGRPETTLGYDPVPGATAHRLLGLAHYNWPP